MRFPVDNYLQGLPSTERGWFVYRVLDLLGAPYIWGGDDPTGADCSGAIILGLQSVGRISRSEDFTAAGLALLLTKDRSSRLTPLHHATGRLPGSIVGTILPGALLFQSKTALLRNIHHVTMSLGGGLMVGASGGGSTTKTRADAIRQNAFVRIDPVPQTSKHWWWAVDVFG